MSPKEKAEKIVLHLMLANDAYSQWLGIEVEKIEIGTCTLTTSITKEMTNGFKICHGGVTYAIADSALAFASNTHGIQAVSVETSISHTKAVKVGDKITAVAVENHLGNQFGIYTVTLTNQDHIIVALFKGTVFRTGKLWQV